MSAAIAHQQQHPSPFLQDRATERLLRSYNAVRYKPPTVAFSMAVRPGLNDDTTAAETPGPGTYGIPSTLYKHPSSQFFSPPSFSMRGREKFGSPDLKAVDRTTQLEPGPGTYTINDGVEQRTAAIKFPRAKADRGALPSNSKVGLEPGPGHYAAVGAIGKQVLSTRKSQAIVGFGTGTRPPLILVSTADVGPGEYTVPGDCGKPQVDSRRRTDGGIRFSKSGRFENANIPEEFKEEGRVPGPGTYKIPTTLAKHPSGRFKSPPVVKMSGRTKFGSPFAQWG
jgi:hypothetical protein